MRRLMLVCAAGVLMLGVVPRSFAQDEVKAIIEKAIKAHGGAEKISKPKGMQSKIKGTLDLAGGIAMTQERTISFSGKLKESAELEVAGQKITLITTYDGNKASITRNGEKVDVSEAIMDELKEAAYALKVSRLTNLLTDKSLELSLLGEVKVDDRPAVGVKVASKGHKDIDLYFDKKSGLLAKAKSRKNDQQTMQEVDEERIVKEYQDVDGQKTAKKRLCIALSLF